VKTRPHAIVLFMLIEVVRNEPHGDPVGFWKRAGCMTSRRASHGKSGLASWRDC